MYILKELDRLQLANTFANDKLKKSHPYQQLQLDYAPNINSDEIPTFDILLTDSNIKLSDPPNDF